MILQINKPQPKQAEFWQAKERYVAYGGARGGGKSWALRNKLVLLCLKHPNIKCLLIRKTYKDLYRNHIQDLLILLRPLIESKIVKYDREHNLFLFKNNAQLIFGYLDSDSDLEQYQGTEYDIIALDEATQFEEKVFHMLKVCIRGQRNCPQRFYLTCNPGGIGHEWVKRLFVDRDFHEGENPVDYRFIQAKATDNQYNGAEYINELNSIQDENLRRAWRDGDWNLYVGQFFPEWNLSKLEEISMPIPSSWDLYMSIDYGLDCFAPIWYGVDYDGTAHIICSLAEKDKIIPEAANIIRDKETELGLNCRRIKRYAPPDLWNRKSDYGRSTIDMFYEAGLYFCKADNNRVAGWLAIKDMLNKNKLKIFKGQADELSRCMSLLQHDDTEFNDCAKDPHDITHLPDSFRYFCIMRTHVPRPEQTAQHNLGYRDRISIYNRQQNPFDVDVSIYTGGWD